MKEQDDMRSKLRKFMQCIVSNHKHTDVMQDKFGETLEYINKHYIRKSLLDEIDAVLNDQEAKNSFWKLTEVQSIIDKHRG